MNDLERDLLQILLHNEPLLNVVKKVFYQEIEKKKPEETDDNEVLGEKYRAYLTAQKIIGQSFTTLLGYKVEKRTDKQFNKER